MIPAFSFSLSLPLWTTCCSLANRPLSSLRPTAADRLRFLADIITLGGMAAAEAMPFAYSDELGMGIKDKCVLTSQGRTFILKQLTNLQ